MEVHRYICWSPLASVDSPNYTQLSNSHTKVKTLLWLSCLCPGCRQAPQWGGGRPSWPTGSDAQNVTSSEWTSSGLHTSVWPFQCGWFWWESIFWWNIFYEVKNLMHFVLSGEVSSVVTFNSVSGQRRETRAPCRIARWEFIDWFFLQNWQYWTMWRISSVWLCLCLCLSCWNVSILTGVG